MAKPSRLHESHRDRVARGEITVAGVSDELGIGRATCHRQFRLRGWPTTAQRKRPGVEPPQGAQDAIEAPEASQHHPAVRPHPAAAAGAAIGLLAQDLDQTSFTDPGDLIAAVRGVAANNALLALARVAELLTSKPGAGAVRLAMQGQLLALDQLRNNLGVDLDATADAGPPQMLFLEMTAQEVAEAQRRAEAEHQGIDLDLEDDQDDLGTQDDQDDDQDAARAGA